MAVSKKHSGWRWDAANTRLKVYINGQDVGRFTSGTDGTNGLELVGRVKIHNHDLTSGYAAEIKAEYNTTGTLSAVDTTVSLNTSMASVRLHGINCTVTNDSGVTITGTSYLHAINGQVNVQGTLNNANIIMAALRGVVAASSGTITAVNSLSCLLLEMKETATITAGKASLLYGMVTGTTTISSALRLETNNVVTNLFDITDAGGLVGSNNAGAISAITGWHGIKVLLNGETHYMIAATSIA